MGVLPMICSAATHVASPSIAPAVARVLSPVSMKMRSMGRRRIVRTSPKEGRVASFDSSAGRPPVGPSAPDSRSGTATMYLLPAQSP